MEAATIKLDHALVESIIRAEVQTAIVGAMNGREEMIATMVAAVLSEKVDDNGKPSSYSSARTYLSWFTRRAIQEAAREALTEYIKESHPKLVAEMKKQIAKQAASGDLAAAFVGGLVKSVESTWRMNVEVSLRTPKED
jgi:hypothetical protein